MGPRFRGDDSDEFRNSPPGCITLHAARIGGGTAAAAVARSGGEATFRPVSLDFHLMTAALQLLDGRLRQAALHHQHAGTRLARPERRRKMLGMPSRRVDRLLQVHSGMHMAQEELRSPLVLLIAARRTPGEIRLAIAQRHGRRKRGARALAGCERIGMALFEPELLRACAETEAELGNRR